MTRGRAIPAAVVRRTEMRAALQHFAGNTDVGLTWIKARLLRTSARIRRDAAGLRRFGFVLRRPPVRRPLPDIADHVADAIAVRRERRHRRGALVSVLAQVLVREIALPGVGHMFAAG